MIPSTALQQHKAGISQALLTEVSGDPLARLNPRNAESVRQTIKAAQLKDLLQDHALGLREVEGNRLESAKFLLRMVLAPPQAAQEHTGELTIRWKS